jgi:hypothetical protein
MGNLLNEIRQFRRFVNLNEEFSPIKNVMFGDELIYFLYDDDITIIKELSDKFLTMTDLITRLSSMEPDFSIDHVFFSIGTDDKFKNTNEIFILSKEIRRAFPKSRLNVIRAIIDESYFYSYEEDKVIDNLELEIDNFYNVFDKANVKVIGTYNSVDYGGGISREKINNIKTEIAKSILDDVTDLDITSPINQNLDTEPFINVNNDVIGGDDETDFDTIYEFLDRFEEIYKSGNQYNRRTNQTHKLDIEQIQIALNFLTNDNIDVNGEYNLETEDVVMYYQNMKGLPETGVCDEETIEELFYDLKIKSFDEDDLSKYITIDNDITQMKKEIRKFTGTVDSVWKSFTDKIIDKFEGGYWNKDITKPNSEKCLNHPYDSMYDNSGETMFGIDRRAGGWDSNSEGREFFGLIDDEKEDAGSMEEFCKKWTYNYRGGDLQGELKLRSSALMKKSYNDNSRYFSSETKKEVESNKRLLFHFAYACWNGSGFFQDFAEDMNRAVSEGKIGDELVNVAVESRNNRFGGTDWADANQKVVDTIKNDPELEN